MTRMGWLPGSILCALVFVRCGDECRSQNGVEVCGDFGAAVYVTALSEWGQTVQWPPVLLDNGRIVLSRDTELLALDGAGDLELLATFDGLLSPVSLGPENMLYVVVSGWEGTYLAAYSLDTGEITRSTTLDGDTANTPPAVADTLLHVTTRIGWDGGTTTTGVHTETFDPTWAREQTSRVVVTGEGVRYLEGATDCWTPHQALVAADATGTIQWRYTHPAGLVDFAPGGEGELYVVTGDRSLVRVNDAGGEDWRFLPPCSDCTVAAAPTVTPEAIYFPVWEGWVSLNTCEPGIVPNNDAIDPLYALDHDGSLLWSYDGFDTESSSWGFLFVPTQETTRHHPSGRPAVAEDGALYVATDGAVVALNGRGKEIGRALYDAQAGEVTDSGWLGWSGYNPGVTPAPVLGRDGTLFVWDGRAVHAFATDRGAALIPWAAPFGTQNNDSRVH